MIKLAILISGRGSNMKALLDACDSGFVPARVELVLSNKSQAPGLEYAKSRGIKTVVIDHKKFSNRQDFDSKIDEELIKENIDIVCLAGFMRLLTPFFVEKWHDRVINIHPSYLPEFKGGDAVGDAIKAGVKQSGCSVHYVRPQMDSGPIIKQVRVNVLEGDDKESLAQRILQQEHKIYPEALKIVCDEYKIKNNL